MKKYVLLLLTLLLVFALTGCDSSSPAATPTPAAKAAPAKASGDVVAEAAVVPVKYAELSLAAQGLIAEVLVKEGEQVKAGQVLVKLDAKRQQAAVQQAEASLARAKASQARNKSSVARAEAALARLQATLAQLKAGARAEDIAVARAAVAVAQAELTRVEKGPDEAQLALAEANVKKAERAVQQAQFAYDRVKDAPFGNIGPDALRLEQATWDLEAARKQYDVLKAGAREVDIAAAKARVAQAEAALTQAQAGARPETITAAEADIRAAEADIAALKTDATAIDADIAVAEAGLAQAKATLADTELKAPFDGIVITLNAKVGEAVSPSTFLVRIADVSAWSIETTDLTELAVGRVKVGDAVTIKVDAFPDLAIAGKVTRVNDFGRNKQGDIVYTIYVTPDKHEPKLRWNMKASVTIKGSGQ
jgi:HlyD family secretion protein